MRPRPGNRTAAERVLKEKERAWRLYQHAKKTRRQDLYATHAEGWHLQAFARQLQRFTPADAAAMLACVRAEARGWLATAPPDIRFEALQLVSERVAQLRQRQGLAPFDDPLPGEGDDLFQQAKRELS